MSDPLFQELLQRLRGGRSRNDTLEEQVAITSQREDYAAIEKSFLLGEKTWEQYSQELVATKDKATLVELFAVAIGMIVDVNANTPDKNAIFRYTIPTLSYAAARAGNLDFVNLVATFFPVLSVIQSANNAVNNDKMALPQTHQLLAVQMVSSVSAICGARDGNHPFLEQSLTWQLFEVLDAAFKVVSKNGLSMLHETLKTSMRRNLFSIVMDILLRESLWSQEKLDINQKLALQGSRNGYLLDRKATVLQLLAWAIECMHEFPIIELMDPFYPGSSQEKYEKILQCGLEKEDEIFAKLCQLLVQDVGATKERKTEFFSAVWSVATTAVKRGAEYVNHLEKLFSTWQTLDSSDSKQWLIPLVVNLLQTAVAHKEFAPFLWLLNHYGHLLSDDNSNKIFDETVKIFKVDRYFLGAFVDASWLNHDPAAKTHMTQRAKQKMAELDEQAVQQKAQVLLSANTQRSDIIKSALMQLSDALHQASVKHTLTAQDNSYVWHFDLGKQTASAIAQFFQCFSKHMGGILDVVKTKAEVTMKINSAFHMTKTVTAVQTQITQCCTQALITLKKLIPNKPVVLSTKNKVDEHSKGIVSSPTTSNKKQKQKIGQSDQSKTQKQNSAETITGFLVTDPEILALQGRMLEVAQSLTKELRLPLESSVERSANCAWYAFFGGGSLLPSQQATSALPKEVGISCTKK